MASPSRVDLGAVLTHIKGQKLSLDTPSNLKKDLDEWLKQQPPAVDAAANLLLGAIQGAALGVVMGTFAKGGKTPTAGAGGAQAAGGQLAAMQAGPFRQARNFAVMTGVNSGVGTFLKRHRKTEDIYNSLGAAFASGAAFSLIGQIGAAPSAPGTAAKNPLVAAVSGGAMFALFQGAFFKLSEKLGRGPGATVAARSDDYVRVKGLLGSLGLERYERNFKRSLLEDRTIMLWDASALTEAKVPPGPRLLILDHVDQYRDILSPAVPIPKGKGRK